MEIRSAPGRDRSKGGFSAPERRKFSPLYRDGNPFRARAQWSKGGFSAPERRKIYPLYRDVNPFHARAQWSKGGFSAPERRKVYPLYRDVNPFRAQAQWSKGGFSAPERRNSKGGSSAEGRGRSTSGSCRYMIKCKIEKFSFDFRGEHIPGTHLNYERTTALCVKLNTWVCRGIT